MQFPRDKFIKHKGFQGFSYVDKDLQRSLAKARWTQGQRVSNLIGVLDTDPGFVEGRPGFRKHLIKERNRTQIVRFKRWVLERKGRLQCEACNFDFQGVYGEKVGDFIECHHKIPIADSRGSRKTRWSELRLLCANCHRAIHLLWVGFNSSLMRRWQAAFGASSRCPS